MGKIIGLVGYKGAGKSSLAFGAIHSGRLHGPAVIVSYSGPIIRMLEALGVPYADLMDKRKWDVPQDVLVGSTIRHAAQTLGTEWGRDRISPSLWCNSGMALAKKLAISNDVIIENVRFPDEADAVREAGGCLIAVYRPGIRIDTSHASEQHIAGLQAAAEYTVANDGSEEHGITGMIIALRLATATELKHLEP